MREFENKVIFITGGANGIGLATARLFVERGARVAIADYDADAGAEALAQLQQIGGEALFLRGDISDADEVRFMVDATVEQLGGLDCAFNNAGICHPGDALWDDDAFDRTFAINVRGMMQCIKAQLRHMVPQRRGAIVNTASVAGLVASVAPSQPAYTASKHAVIGLTKSVALRHARDGIRVNAVLPGVTMTNMVRDVMEQGPEVRATLENLAPMGRMARPEEVGEAVLWLCSDRASFVTAHALAVDGGALAQ
ncbi:glucose 1-dehydrogenase [Sphingobium sp.]|uniref:SDR family NAD(P)-dependent oxidoreductase n=1 Tax=Sphingobium sp. TaxID=1912891 RepID=UPI00261634A5|nr:glucose 1-dehydrogenase [Sphingobium sp.]